MKFPSRIRWLSWRLGDGLHSKTAAIAPLKLASESSFVPIRCRTFSLGFRHFFFQVSSALLSLTLIKFVTCGLLKADYALHEQSFALDGLIETREDLRFA